MRCVTRNVTAQNWMESNNRKRLCGYVLTRFLRLRTFAHGNVEQPACRDLEHTAEYQKDTIKAQMQVM